MKKRILYSILIIFTIAFFVIINKNIKGVYIGDNEFLRTVDYAPMFDANPTGTRYKVSFDIRTEVPGKVIIYSQNGTTSRYKWEPVPEIETTTDFVHHEIVIEPILINEDVKEAYLAFYGTYGSGAIPIVKNLEIVCIK